MYYEAVTEKYPEHCELVGLCDNNAGRLEMRCGELAAKGFDVPTFAENEFDRMIVEQKPDVVIVTPRDDLHDRFICRAMELGCNVITEKPMTIDAARCQKILDTVEKTGKNVTVTFNYRYSPPRSQVKELLVAGAVGEVLSVDFHWLLDTHHGADYYRRWHRNKANSGGLMVHKATHHFDLVSWWLSSVPQTVTALGGRSFYTPLQAAQYGLEGRSERCLDCSVAGKCPFYLDMKANEGLKKLYLDHEQHDGYFRDRCVFSEQIDIEDSMNVAVRYQSGAHLSYSLNSFMPWEGYHVAFNGTKGRLEHSCQEKVYISGDGTVPGETKAGETTIKVYPHFQAPSDVPVRVGTGGHGGGDTLLEDDLFLPSPPADPLNRAANQFAGAYSILTGIAANLAMAEGQVDSLVKGLQTPDYPEMPQRSYPNET